MLHFPKIWEQMQYCTLIFTDFHLRTKLSSQNHVILHQNQTSPSDFTQKPSYKQTHTVNHNTLVISIQNSGIKIWYCNELCHLWLPPDQAFLTFLANCIPVISQCKPMGEKSPNQAVGGKPLVYLVTNPGKPQPLQLPYRIIKHSPMRFRKGEYAGTWITLLYLQVLTHCSKTFELTRGPFT